MIHEAVRFPGFQRKSHRDVHLESRKDVDRKGNELRPRSESAQLAILVLPAGFTLQLQQLPLKALQVLTGLELNTRS